MKSLFFSWIPIVTLVACGGAAPPVPAEPTSAPVPPAAAATNPAESTAKAAAPAETTNAAPKPQAPTPPKEPEITSVRVAVSNKCETPMDYCVDDSTTLYTTLTQRTTTTHTVKPGAKLRARKGSSCGDVLFTVPASKDEVKATICGK